jgi:hypothetical protein
VSNALVVDGVNLGMWIDNCRARYRRGSLLKETTLGLEAISGWSWSGADTLAQHRREKAEGRAARIAEIEEQRGLGAKPERDVRGVPDTTPVGDRVRRGLDSDSEQAGGARGAREAHACGGFGAA